MKHTRQAVHAIKQSLLLRCLWLEPTALCHGTEGPYLDEATTTTFLAFFSFFLAVAINSTNEANKAGSMHAVKKSLLLRCLWLELTTLSCSPGGPYLDEATTTTFLAFFCFFLALAINSTNEAYKAGSTCC